MGRRRAYLEGFDSPPPDAPRTDIVEVVIGPHIRLRYPAGDPTTYPDWLPTQRDFNSPPLEYIEPWWAPDCSPDDPKAGPSGRDNKRPPSTIKWGSWQLVDDALEDSWIERMNSIPKLQTAMTCAGHEESRAPYPWIKFELPYSLPITRHIEPMADMKWGSLKKQISQIKVLTDYLERQFADIAEVTEAPVFNDEKSIGITLKAWLPRVWMTDCQYAAWWEEILGRLEELASFGWSGT